MARKEIYRYLDTDGDGGGTKTMLSAAGTLGTPVRHKFAPTRGANIGRIILHIEDVGAVEANKYGAAAALTNGIVVGVYKQSDDAEVIDLTDGLPIKVNAHWSRMCYDGVAHSFAAGPNFWQVRWTFLGKGTPLVIHPDEYLGILLRDDMSVLTDHTAMVQGNYD